MESAVPSRPFVSGNCAPAPTHAPPRYTTVTGTRSGSATGPPHTPRLSIVVPAYGAPLSIPTAGARHGLSSDRTIPTALALSAGSGVAAKKRQRGDQEPRDGTGSAQRQVKRVKLSGGTKPGQHDRRGSGWGGVLKESTSSSQGILANQATFHIPDRGGMIGKHSADTLHADLDPRFTTQQLHHTLELLRFER